MCYVTGEQEFTTERHANKIRHAADKAKLISSNDTNSSRAIAEALVIRHDGVLEALRKNLRLTW